MGQAMTWNLYFFDLLSLSGLQKHRKVYVNSFLFLFPNKTENFFVINKNMNTKIQQFILLNYIMFMHRNVA